MHSAYSRAISIGIRLRVPARRTRMTIQRDKKGSSECSPRETDRMWEKEGGEDFFSPFISRSCFVSPILFPKGIYGSQIGAMNDGRYCKVPSSRMNISIGNATIEM